MIGFILSVLLFALVFWAGFVMALVFEAKNPRFPVDPKHRPDWIIRIPLILLSGLSFFFNTVFNWTAGIVIFRGIPQTILFTEEVTRHLLAAEGTNDRRRAEEWKGVLEDYGLSAAIT